MADPSSIPITCPPRIGGYRIMDELAPGRTFLAEAMGGRRVVLKILEADCLLGRQLHPLIKDRLGRVRELAHLGVANLCGVEREGDRVYAVWEYIEGLTLEEHLNASPRTLAELAALARDVAMLVDSVHALGVIHGVLHPRNVIVTANGSLRLTHFSPLLYTDPSTDIQALLVMFGDWFARRGGTAALEGLKAESISLHDLITRLAALAEPNPGSTGQAALPSFAPAVEPSEAEDRRARRMSLVVGLLVAALGLVVTLSLWYLAGSTPDQPSGKEDRPAIVEPPPVDAHSEVAP